MTSWSSEMGEVIFFMWGLLEKYFQANQPWKVSTHNFNTEKIIMVWNFIHWSSFKSFNMTYNNRVQFIFVTKQIFSTWVMKKKYIVERICAKKNSLVQPNNPTLFPEKQLWLSIYVIFLICINLVYLSVPNIFKNRTHCCPWIQCYASCKHYSTIVTARILKQCQPVQFYLLEIFGNFNWNHNKKCYSEIWVLKITEMRDHLSYIKDLLVGMCTYNSM